MSVQSHDPERRAVADRISEDVLQLLYTARQDLAELDAGGVELDPRLVKSAHACTSGAISILRGVVATVLSAAWGPPPGAVADPDRETIDAHLFDALTEAWIITCEEDDLLFASRAAYDVLGHGAGELAALMREPGTWPHLLAQVPKSAHPSRDVEFVVEIPSPDGPGSPVRIRSHLLPGDTGVPTSYLSRLTVPA